MGEIFWRFCCNNSLSISEKPNGSLTGQDSFVSLRVSSPSVVFPYVSSLAATAGLLSTFELGFHLRSSSPPSFSLQAAAVLSRVACCCEIEPYSSPGSVVPILIIERAEGEFMLSAIANNKTDLNKAFISRHANFYFFALQ